MPSTLRRRNPGRFRYRKRRRFMKRTNRTNNYINNFRSKGSKLTYSLKTIVPDRLRTKLTYGSVNTFTSAAGVTSEYVYRGNSCFDPDQAGAGAQPNGFDQLSALYNRYRVYSSRIKYQPINVSSSATTNIVFYSYASRTTTGLATVFDYMGAPYAKWAAGNANTLGNRTLITHLSTAAVLGLSGGQMEADDTLEALVTASPAHQWYWIIGTYSEATQSTSAYVSIDYYVEFTDRIDLNAS